VLATSSLHGDSGGEFLSCVAVLYPEAKRGLLIAWGGWADRATAGEIRRAMAQGWIDYYVLEPEQSPDELFHRTVSDFLHEWWRVRGDGPHAVSIGGDRWSPRVHELRSLLSDSGIPHAFSESLRAGAEGAPAGAAHLPVVAVRGGPTLVDPTDMEVADACGLPTRLTRTTFDLVVVGAGPAGLTAAVYAASEGLTTLVVERRSIGGQAGASSRIRNYPGFPRGIAGSDLTMRTYQQAWVLGAHFLLMQEVADVDAREEGISLSFGGGDVAEAAAVVIATGVAYRRLGVPSLEALVGAGVYYGASTPDPQTLAGEHVVVVGGGNSAGQAALHVARYASRVTLAVRGPSLVRTMSRYLIDELAGAPNVEVRPRTSVVGGGGAKRLEHVVLAGAAGEQSTVPAAALLVVIGGEPRTGWLDASVVRDGAGYVLTGDEAARAAGQPRLPLETSVSGVFAAGDARHGAIKRVASAVGEGAAVVAQVHEYLERGHAA
jgi:thioredoxin reductase (NADPH)